MSPSPMRGAVSARNCARPGAERLLYMADALRLGMDEQEVYELSRIDPWFIGQIADLVREEEAVSKAGWEAFSDGRLLRLKRKGFADSRLAHLLGVAEEQVTERRAGGRDRAGVQAGGQLRR